MKGDLTYLRHILDAIERIRANASKGRDAFLADVNLQDAVVRQLEIIGEATKRLSPGIRDRHRAVPWRRIAGLRDKLIQPIHGSGSGHRLGDCYEEHSGAEVQHGEDDF